VVPLVFVNFPESFRLVRQASLTCVRPLLSIIDFVTNTSFSLVERVVYPHWLVEENQKLNEKIDELEAYLIQLKEVEDENQRLRSLLKFNKEVVGEVMPALIVGRDANQWNSSLILNKGKKDGVMVNMPVVTDFGLVGLVVDVGARLSRVILVTDPGFKVSVMVQNSRVEGILQGHGVHHLVMHYVPQDSEVDVYDVLITSGLGGIFPKGLIVGGVQSIHQSRNELFKNIVIKPSIDFSSLEEVLIMMNKRDI
jgi:rod shape-determining protein MreC